MERFYTILALDNNDFLYLDMIKYQLFICDRKEMMKYKNNHKYPLNITYITQAKAISLSKEVNKEVILKKKIEEIEKKRKELHLESIDSKWYATQEDILYTKEISAEISLIRHSIKDGNEDIKAILDKALLDINIIYVNKKDLFESKKSQDILEYKQTKYLETIAEQKEMMQYLQTIFDKRNNKLFSID